MFGLWVLNVVCDESNLSYIKKVNHFQDDNQLLKHNLEVLHDQYPAYVQKSICGAKRSTKKNM